MIPGDIKPVYIGVYRRKFPEPWNATLFSRWDGANWTWAGHTAEDAAGHIDKSEHQNLPWCGAEFTDWFDADVKPAHVGVYERDFNQYESGLDCEPEFGYWDGNNWYYGDRDPDSTMKQFHTNTAIATIPRRWRGLKGA